jgi:hypothetical protein
VVIQLRQRELKAGREALRAVGQGERLNVIADLDVWFAMGALTCTNQYDLRMPLDP